MAFYTPEESRLRHIAQVREWQKRNPEKHRSYVDKYSNKPGMKEKRREQMRARYHERKRLKSISDIDNDNS